MFKAVLIVAGIAVTLPACDRQMDKGSAKVLSESESAVVAENTDTTVLATVNGDAITQDDLDAMIARTFTAGEQVMANREVTDKILDSLIASKAMAQMVKQEMNAREITAIEQKVKAYEEELFVKEYLSRNVKPEPVTQTMVKEYYDNNAEKFGAITVRQFEQLKASRRLTDDERDALIGDRDRIAEIGDWRSFVQTAKNAYPLVYQNANATPGLLEKRLESAIKGLAKGQTSQVLFIDSIPTIFRIVDEKQLPPKPLHEVSADIRKSLAPLQLRKAVKKATEEVLTKVKVERKHPPDQG